MKLLYAGDDLERFRHFLVAQGRDWQLVTASDGQEALAVWCVAQPIIVVLDVHLPGLDGFEVCQQIQHDSETPVILLAAPGEDVDLVRARQVGAYDIVPKPLRPEQLAARISAVLRGWSTRRDAFRQLTHELQVGELLLDLLTHSVTRGGRLLALTRLEFRILLMLAQNEGRAVPSARLVEYGWGYYDEEIATLLPSYIAQIRSKLGLPADGPESIRHLDDSSYLLSCLATPSHSVQQERSKGLERQVTETRDVRPTAKVIPGAPLVPR